MAQLAAVQPENPLFLAHRKLLVAPFIWQFAQYYRMKNLISQNMRCGPPLSLNHLQHLTQSRPTFHRLTQARPKQAAAQSLVNHVEIGLVCPIGHFLTVQYIPSRTLDFVCKQRGFLWLPGFLVRRTKSKQAHIMDSHYTDSPAAVTHNQTGATPCKTLFNQIQHLELSAHDALECSVSS